MGLGGLDSIKYFVCIFVCCFMFVYCEKWAYTLGDFTKKGNCKIRSCFGDIHFIDLQSICVRFVYERSGHTLGNFTKIELVIVIHLVVCSIYITECSVLLFCVLYMLVSVQPKDKVCLVNEWYVCIM